MKRLLVSPCARLWLCLGLLLGLVLCTRLLAALRRASLPNDGIAYLQSADQILKGSWSVGELLPHAQHPGYPITIAAVASIVADLEIAALIVSILAALLTTIPLYLLLRRAIGPDRAHIGVILFAFHPRLVEYQSDVLSNSLMLLLLVWGAYFLVRATQGSAWAGAACAASSLLAVAVRAEGWVALGTLGLLLAAWVAWPLRKASLGAFKLRLPSLMAFLAVLGAAVFLMILFNPAFLFGDRARTPYVLNLLGSVSRPEGGGPLDFWKSLVGAWIAPYLLLVIWGSWLARGHDDSASAYRLLLLASVYVAALAIYYSVSGVISKRYFLGPVVLTLPLASKAIAHANEWFKPRLGPTVAGGLLFLALLSPMVELIQPRLQELSGYREAGVWIRTRFGEGRSVLSTRPQPAYYAGGTFVDLELLLRRKKPLEASLERVDVIVLRMESLRPPTFNEGLRMFILTHPRFVRVAGFRDVEVFASKSLGQDY